jgi:Acyl-CoA reductase (LuxC)
VVLADFQLPPGVSRPTTAPSEVRPAPATGSRYLSARWTPAALEALAAALGHGGEALRELPDEALLEAWAATVDAFLDPGSPERRRLTAPLAALCGLSAEGFAAGLEAVLGGVRREPAALLLRRAGPIRGAAAAAAGRSGPGPSVVLVVLASNLPALAVQPLLPALALRRPVLLKSPSAEPLFAPAFLAALARREPRLAGAVAAVTWPGGDAALEAPLLAAARTVLAYGGSEAVADLARRAPGKVVEYGPKTSLAVVEMAGGDAEAAVLAAALARDVALFDQRGCLSVAAVYVAGGLDEAARLARHLEAALAAAAVRWPPGPAAPPDLAAVQQARLEAELRGLPGAATLPPAAGTVLVEPEPALRPSPGLRTVRVHPLPDLARLPGILAPWRGRLQGAALAGPAAWRLAPRLAELGISRCAAPGELQSPDAAWHNGGIDPLLALAGAAAPAAAQR